MSSVTGSKPKPAVLAQAIGGVFLIIGSLLPFFSISAGGQSESFGGMDTEDGKYYLSFGIIFLIFAAVLMMSKGRTMKKVFGILGILLGAFSTYAAFIDITGSSDEVTALGFDYSTGIGLYIVALGSILALIGALMAVFKPGDEEVMPMSGPPEPLSPPDSSASPPSA